MIIKETQGHAKDIRALEALKAVADQAFHTKIDRKIAKLRSGEAGERSAAHFINREFGRSANLAILHDLRIGVDGDFAQIDHLLVHRFQQAAWVLETKNYTGNLSCDEHGDWTVWRGRKPMPVPSPVNQARRQAILLSHWFEQQGITAIRRIVPVVLISPTSSVNRKHLDESAQVVKSDNFSAWWAREAEKIGITEALGMMGRHLFDGLSNDGFLELCQRLCHAHVPPNRNWQVELGLPVVAEQDLPLQAEEPVCTGFPRVIETAHGRISISQLPDGRLALKNDRNEALIDIVRSSCRGRARWNPRYRNWVFDADRLDEIEQLLGSVTRE